MNSPNVVVFPFTWAEPKSADTHLAEKMCASLRHAEQRFDRKPIIVQMASMESKALPFVDVVHRVKMDNFGEWYFECMASLPYWDFLRLDHDIIMRLPPWEVFDHHFDIAVAKEHKGMMNNGVVFVRNKAFFTYALEVYRNRTTRNDWNDIQVATQLAIDDGVFRVRKIDPNVYNCIPDRADGVHPDAKIVHFKDERKEWMLAA